MNETINSVFTETQDGINASINQLEVTCITSKQNNFHLDSEGNLSVNSITTVVDNPTTSTTVDFNSIYPIGSIYMNTALVDPVTLFGGTWELLKNRFLIGAGDLYEVGEMKGEIEHKLTKEEITEIVSSAKSRVYSIVKGDALDILHDVVDDVDAWIENKIEKHVELSKNK